MLKSCKYCGRVHDESYDCGMKPKEKKRYNNIIDRFRGSDKWKRKRAEILQRDNHLCQHCIREGTIEPNAMLSVHHAIPLEADFDKRLDSDNLITLCSTCHAKAEEGIYSYKEIKDIIDEQEDKAKDIPSTV